jgi:hypothetical protein
MLNVKIWWNVSIDKRLRADSSLLKLSPGVYLSYDVKHALYVYQSFHVSPTADDVRFLAK